MENSSPQATLDAKKSTAGIISGRREGFFQNNQENK
jgi:hypothetical protein